MNKVHRFRDEHSVLFLVTYPITLPLAIICIFIDLFVMCWDYGVPSGFRYWKDDWRDAPKGMVDTLKEAISRVRGK
jgi:hypothetical protein